jgi:hypothetical protein
MKRLTYFFILFFFWVPVTYSQGEFNNWRLPIARVNLITGISGNRRPFHSMGALLRQSMAALWLLVKDVHR